MINEFERLGAFDDDLPDIEDYWERYEEERVDPKTPQAVHAKSIVGHWCKGADTPIQGDILVKVKAINKHDLGQVEVTVFKASKGMFPVRHWILGCSSGNFGSTWLQATDERPCLKDWPIALTSTLIEKAVLWIEHEQKCLKYSWWKDGSLLYHERNPYISNILNSLYELALAFKYGVGAKRR